MQQILLIEDNAALRQMLTEALVEAGYSVTTAANGEEGCQLYRKYKFKLVITDIFMPDKEGLETIRELKEINPELDIIAMSGGGTRSFYAGSPGAELALKAAQRLGAGRVLNKPFKLSLLIDMVSELTA